MRKLFLFLTLLFAFASGAKATTVSGTVVDAGSHAYANGTVVANLVPPAGTPVEQVNINGTPVTTPVTTTTNGSGVFSFTLPANNTMAPAGATWTVTVTSSSGSTSTSTNQIITGATQSLSTALSAVSPAIAGSAFVNSRFALGTTPFQANAAAGQTAALFNLFDYAGNSLFSISASGATTCVSGCGSGAVSSVFGRTGAVVAASADYTCSLVTNCLTTSAGVIGLFSGCSGTQYLGADGACHTASGGSGTVTNTLGALSSSGFVLGNGGSDVATSTTYTFGSLHNKVLVAAATGYSSNINGGFLVDGSNGGTGFEVMATGNVNPGLYFTTSIGFDGAVTYNPSTQLLRNFIGGTLRSAQDVNGNMAVTKFLGAGALDTASAVTLCTGSETIGGISATTLASCVSLSKYKTNILPLLSPKRPSMLSEAMLLKPVSYDPRKPGGFTTGHELGLIAEDVEKVDSRLSTYDHTTKELQGVQYDRVGVVAIAAIQELKHVIDNQQLEIKTLEEEVAILKVK